MFQQLAISQNAIINYDSTYVNLQSDSKAEVFRSISYTVLNKRFHDEAIIRLYEDEFDKYVKVEVEVLDARGVRVEKYSKKDMMVRSEGEGEGVLDVDLYILDPSHTSYPYTVNLEYENKVRGILSFNDWRAVEHYNVTVNNPSLTIKKNEKTPLRYKSFGIEPTEFEYDGDQYLKWKIYQPITEIQSESYAPPLYNLTPHVILAPGDFEIENYEGSCNSWEEFGQWVWNLIDGRDELPESTVEFLKSEFGSIEDPYERINAVYAWMQKRTRYVSIQLGIGGWQPMKAGDVDKFGYGDCKALVNYTKAALEAVDISCNYALVYSSRYRDRVIADFPSNRFNHVVLQIPFEKDTVWLECTSQVLPFNYMSLGTSGHHALVIRNNASYLTRISRNANDSYKTTAVANVNLTPQGSAVISSNINYQEANFDRLVPLTYMDTEEQKVYVSESMRLNGPSIQKYKVDLDKEKLEIRLTSEILSTDYAKVMGNLITFSPPVLDSDLPEFGHNPERQYDIVLTRGEVNNQNLVINLPAGYKVEHLPRTLEIANEFGQYSIQYQVNGDKLFIMYNYDLKAGNYPREKYRQLRSFVKEIEKNINRKVVLISS